MDLLEILFVAAFILFGLLGGRKKRSQQQPPRPGTRPASPRPARPPARVPRAPPQHRAEPAVSQDRLLQELEGLLSGRPVPHEAESLEDLDVEETGSWEEGIERAGEVHATEVWQAGRDRAADSVETLEAAGGASHQRFHALYDRQPEPIPEKRTRATFRNTDVRRAVVWSEILAPPVSLRE